MKRLFIDQLLQWKNSAGRKPLIIKGMRQIGKTYSISDFGAHHFPKTHYLNFEKDTKLAPIFAADLDPKRIINELGLYLHTNITVTQDLIFFDEIQSCPRALTSLKYFCEEMPELAVCAAGSLLGVHLNSESFPVGKVNILEMFPMSFVEFLLAQEDKKSVDFLNELKADSKIPQFQHDYLWQQMKYYFITGGLPEVVKIFVAWKENLYEAFKQVREKQRELIIAYAADMAKHSGKTNSMHIDRVWHSIPAQLAREQDGMAAKFQFKHIIPGINRYSRLVNVIDWLLGAGMIIKVPIISHVELPLMAYTQENAFKLFMSDVGLLGAMSDLNPETILQYDYGTYKGYFAENFVLQEFYSAGFSPVYCWQENHAEVEFIREISGQIIPLEVKSGMSKHAKSLAVFMKRYHPDYGVILSGSDFNISPHHPIQHYPLYLASRVSSILLGP